VKFCLRESEIPWAGLGLADDLSPEEALELEAIGELDEIFSYINAVIATHQQSAKPQHKVES
jgi:hypothetical protein